MPTVAVVSGIVGGVVALGVVASSAWVGYRIVGRRDKEPLVTMKVDVEAQTIRTVVPVPMPGASYGPPVPVLVAAHSGWGLRAPPRPRARRMLRSPARRASENALPALCELGESEFGDSDKARSLRSVGDGRSQSGEDEFDWGDGMLGVPDTDSTQGDGGTAARSDAKLALHVLGGTQEAPPDVPPRVDEHEPEPADSAEESAESETRPGEGIFTLTSASGSTSSLGTISDTSDGGSTLHVPPRTESTSDLCPPETPSTLDSFPVTPTSHCDFDAPATPVDIGFVPAPPDDISSDSETSTPTSTPEGTLERPKRRSCIDVDGTVLLGTLMLGHYN